MCIYIIIKKQIYVLRYVCEKQIKYCVPGATIADYCIFGAFLSTLKAFWCMSLFIQIHFCKQIKFIKLFYAVALGSVSVNSASGFKSSQNDTWVNSIFNLGLKFTKSPSIWHDVLSNGNSGYIFQLREHSPTHCRTMPQ